MLLIRHGDDEAKDRRYPLDPHIRGSGERDVRRAARKFLKKYGAPDAIMHSPMTRARDTARILAEEIEEISGKAPRIKTSSQLCRFFFERDFRDGTPRLRSSTLEQRVPMEESRREFRKRVKSFVRENSSDNVWCVTHAVFIKDALKMAGGRAPSNIPFLWKARISK